MMWALCWDLIYSTLVHVSFLLFLRLHLNSSPFQKHIWTICVDHRVIDGRRSLMDISHRKSTVFLIRPTKLIQQIKHLLQIVLRASLIVSNILHDYLFKPALVFPYYCFWVFFLDHLVACAIHEHSCYSSIDSLARSQVNTERVVNLPTPALVDQHSLKCLIYEAHRELY
jgi:hypothetical protein